VDTAATRLNEFLSKVVPVLEPCIPGRELQAVAGQLPCKQSSIPQ